MFQNRIRKMYYLLPTQHVILDDTNNCNVNDEKKGGMIVL